MSASLEPFIDAAPEFVLRMFAMDCAERLFWREKMRACDPGPEYWKRLKLLRQSQIDAIDDESHKDLQTMALLSYADGDGVTTGSFTAQHRSQIRACSRAMWATTMPDAKRGALTAAQALQTMGAESELSWALGRLTWLTGTYQWAGDRMAFLIPEGEIDTPAPLQVRAQ